MTDNRIAVYQAKTKTRLLIPLHRDLAEVLSRIERRSVFILTNTRGVPWTQSGFKASWGKMCTRIGVSDHLVFHGLRKSAVVMLLEAGCTTAEESAITGQSMQMVEHYSKEVNQKRLAASAILKWERAT